MRYVYIDEPRLHDKMLVLAAMFAIVLSVVPRFSTWCLMLAVVLDGRSGQPERVARRVARLAAVLLHAAVLAVLLRSTGARARAAMLAVALGSTWWCSPWCSPCGGARRRARRRVRRHARRAAVLVVVLGMVLDEALVPSSRCWLPRSLARCRLLRGRPPGLSISPLPPWMPCPR